jgi:hypothetical protein
MKIFDDQRSFAMACLTFFYICRCTKFSPGGIRDGQCNVFFAPEVIGAVSREIESHLPIGWQFKNALILALQL